MYGSVGSDVPFAGDELRVLTLNVWLEQAPKRLEDIAAAVQSKNPDVVCLQEAFSMKVIQKFQKEFGKDYEIAHFKTRFTVGATLVIFMYFGIMFLFFWGIFALVGLGAPVLSATGLAWQIAAGIALLLTVLTLYLNPKGLTDFAFGNLTGLALLVRRSRISNVSVNAVLFKERWCDYLNWIRPRGYLCISGILFRSVAEGSRQIPFKFVTTHLDQVISQPEGRGRIAQAKEILAEFQGFEGFVVAAADWNFTPTTNPGGTKCGSYELMHDKLDDAWDGQTDLGPTWDQQGNPLAVSKSNDMAYQNDELMRWRCDITFWKNTSRENVSVKSCEVVFQGSKIVSDHYGLLTIFHL